MITLPWMDKIRERLAEYKDHKDLTTTEVFLEPILQYGLAEEKRIASRIADNGGLKKWE